MVRAPKSDQTLNDAAASLTNGSDVQTHHPDVFMPSLSFSASPHSGDISQTGKVLKHTTADLVM